MDTLTKSEKINLDIKKIAKKVREELKAKFQKCTFSITIERYSMGQSLTVALMTAPFEVFKEQNERNYGQLNKYQFIRDGWEQYYPTPLKDWPRKTWDIAEIVQTMKDSTKPRGW